MEKGPGYATALLLEFFAGARCPLVLVRSEGAAVLVYG